MAKIQCRGQEVAVDSRAKLSWRHTDRGYRPQVLTAVFLQIQVVCDVTCPWMS
jgi:hypothetical protein